MTETIARIQSPAVPDPAGHYAHATAWRDLVFVSGQLAPYPGDGPIGARPFETQVRQALSNMLAILAEAACGSHGILRVTAYIVGVEHWAAFDRVYADVLGDARPARTVVPVPELHHGGLVEIEAVAARAA